MQSSEYPISDALFSVPVCCAAGPRAGPSGQRPPGGSMGSVVQRASQALQERGERLGRAEDKTVDLMHKAQQFADTAHKV